MFATQSGGFVVVVEWKSVVLYGTGSKSASKADNFSQRRNSTLTAFLLFLKSGSIFNVCH